MTIFRFRDNYMPPRSACVAASARARLLGAVDIFVLWWVVLLAMGLGMLYRTRTLPIARWLFGAYAAGALALAATQALRGGM